LTIDALDHVARVTTVGVLAEHLQARVQHLLRNFNLSTGLSVRIIGHRDTFLKYIIGIKIVPPGAWLAGTEEYDLIVNFDSITEMDRAVAMAYWKGATARAGQLLSINHESNSFRFHDLMAAYSAFVSTTRNPCFMRRGYVEEYVKIR